MTGVMVDVDVSVAVGISVAVIITALGEGPIGVKVAGNTTVGSPAVGCKGFTDVGWAAFKKGIGKLQPARLNRRRTKSGRESILRRMIFTPFFTDWLTSSSNKT